MYFNGTSDHVSLPSPLALEGKSWSIVQWITPTLGAYMFTFVLKDMVDPADGHEINILIFADGTIRLSYRGEVVHDLLAPPGTITDGVEQLIVCTYDHLTGISTIYVDHTEVASGEIGAFTGAPDKMEVGWFPGDVDDDPFGPGFYFLGTIVDTAIFEDVVLSPAQVTAYDTALDWRHRLVALQGDHPTRYYSLDEPQSVVPTEVYGGGTGAITYGSNRTGAWQVYQTRVDRAGEVKLVDHASDDYMPRWSPDGREFAFVSTRSGTASLWKMRPGQRAPSQLTTQNSEGAAWSPNGAWIAYEALTGGTRDVWIMRPDGSGQTQVTFGPGNNRQPWWSPDGAHIVFSSDRGGSYDLYVMDADGSNVTLLPTVAGAQNREPRWSPDGSRIAFRSNWGALDNIWAVAPDGTGLEQLTVTGHSLAPMWSLDGTFIAFHTLDAIGGGAQVQAMNLANFGLATITVLHTWSDAHPSWQPVSIPTAVAPLPQQQANYQLVVLSPTTGAVEAVVDGTAWHSFTYSRVLNGIGDFVVELPNDVRWQGVFVLDALVDVLRSDPANPRRLVKEETYFVRRVQQLREEPEERLIVAGRSLNHLLTRRVINPSADPLVAGGYSTKAGPADQVIRDYVLEQLGANAQAARRAANFSVAPVTNVGQAVGDRLRFENLFEVVEKLAKSGGVDFVIERVEGTGLEMRIGHFGADRTRSTNYPMMRWVGLSPLRGNLTNPSLLIDRTEEANFVYALGEGQGVYRDILEVGELSANDSPWNLIEYVEDVRNVSRGDAVQLYTQARVSLADKAARQEFTFEPTGTEPGNTYRVDWDLGDVVTVLWGDYELDLRVTAVTLEAGQAAERIQVKVERP